jgi:hypothetical protein
MYITVDYEGELQKFVKLSEKLSKAHLLAITKATNREGVRLRTFLFKSVRAEYSVKTSDLKRASKEEKATVAGVKSNECYYSLGITSNRLPLSYFGAKERFVKGVDGIRRRGVSVKILKKEKRKVVKSAFLHKGHIFKRESQSQYPLKFLTSLSIPQMFREDIVEKGYSLVESHFTKTYEDSLEYYISKLK